MRDASPHGLDVVTVQRAFEISSNVGIARLVELGYGNDAPGRQAFVDKLRAFRLDRPTGISLDGEKLPLIKDPSAVPLEARHEHRPQVTPPVGDGVVEGHHLQRG